MSLTPNPQRIMKGNQGIEVAAWSFISQAAVKAKTGEKKDHMIGSEYTLGGLYYRFSAAVWTVY